MLGLFVGALIAVSSIPAQRTLAAGHDGIDDSGGGGSEQAIAELSAALRGDTNGEVKLTINPATELVSLVGAPAGKALTEPAQAPPDQIATEFLADYAPLFGIDGNNGIDGDNGNDLVVDRVSEGLHGTSAVRFQQQVDGVPVFAGEVAVQVDPDGRIVSASGESSPAVDIDTSPTFDARAAATAAIRATSELDTVDSALLTATLPERWIYDPQLIGAAEDSAPRLVWRVTVSTEIGDVERLVLVDAHDGSIALQVSTRDNIGPGRSVCNNDNDDSFPQACTVPVRVEGGQPTANIDVDSAYDLAGVTYSFYKNVLGRDGIDGHDFPITSTVNFCTPSRTCPFKNAFWSGDQMVYGSGYARADDVVAHELTHGVTDHTSKLFYYGESGAINESISDVFGELIDQSDTTSGPDPVGVKWLIGEQLPGGPLRRMDFPNIALPGRSPDPDRMTSFAYEGNPGDSHGVHTNSGVGNKAAFLITDGGTFNGQTVTGLGITKTVQIYYQAQTTLLGPGSDYLDLFGALQQACAALVGGSAGITAIDCQQVTKAVTATEMNLAPTTPGARLTAAECQAGTVRGETLFSDDMEAGIGKWVTTASDPAAVWTSFSGSSQSGTKSMYGPDIEAGPLSSSNRSMTSQARIANSISIPTGNTYLRFEHSFNLEGNTSGTMFYDGGVVEYSTNGVNGPWIDAESLGMVNGYNGTLTNGSSSPASTNPLRGRRAFSDTSPGYQQTRIDLSSLAAQKNVMFRFRIGTDQFSGADGWFIDDVAVYRCGPTAVPTAPRFASASITNGTAAIQWSPPESTGFPTLTNYVVTRFANGIPDGVTNTTTTSLMVGAPTAGVTYAFAVAAQNPVGVGPGATATIKFFSAIGPARVLDTRPGESPNALRSVTKIKIGGANVLQVQVSDLPGLTPVNGVAAVSLNITATGASTPGFITVYPCGQRALVSTVNYVANDTVANAAITPVSANGTICLFSNTPVDAVVDINGWFGVSLGYSPIGPARVVDTRPGESPAAVRSVTKTKIGGANVLEVTVADLPGYTPASGIGAVSLNVTATGGAHPGFVTVYPCGGLPTVSNLNYSARENVANAVVTPVSAAGTICIYAQTDVDVVVDINGWFAATPGFAPIGPARVLDTRPGESPTAIRPVAKVKVGGANVLEVEVADLPGYTPGVGIDAVSLNVTVTGATAPGFVTVYPCGARNLVSNLNYTAGDIVANAVITPVSATGTICLYALTTVDLIVDINGWFAA